MVFDCCRCWADVFILVEAFGGRVRGTTSAGVVVVIVVVVVVVFVV